LRKRPRNGGKEKRRKATPSMGAKTNTAQRVQERQEKMTEPAVVVAGTIVRNRSWIIKEHIASLKSNNPSFLFYLQGDSSDNTKELLLDSNVDILNHDVGNPNWRRGTYSSSVMGSLRELWTKTALALYPEATHLWSVDSDVLPPSNALHTLLGHKKDVMAAYVPVSNGAIPIHMYGWDERDKEARRTGQEKIHESVLRRCTLVGACVLMTRKVAEIPDLYGKHNQGEDGYFGDRMRERGIDMWVDTLVICEHRMNEPEEWKLKWGVQ